MNCVSALTGSWSLFAAFLAGTAGSVHCLAMCGGLSGALTLRVRRAGAPAVRATAHSLILQCGRLASYALAGGLGAGVIGMMPELFAWQSLGPALRALAGLVLIGAATGMLFRWRPLALIERLGARLWRHLSPLTRALPADRFGGSLLLGMLWGWLPCGMVYSMVLVAALSGSAAKGAATMLCFGLGTLPAVLSAGLASARILRLTSGRGLNAVFGMLLLAFGILTAIAPWNATLHLPL